MLPWILLVVLKEWSSMRPGCATWLIPVLVAARPVRIPESITILTIRLESEVPLSRVTLASLLVVVLLLEHLVFAGIVHTLSVRGIKFPLLICWNIRASGWVGFHVRNSLSPNTTLVSIKLEVTWNDIL